LSCEYSGWLTGAAWLVSREPRPLLPSFSARSSDRPRVTPSFDDSPEEGGAASSANHRVAEVEISVYIDVLKHSSDWETGRRDAMAFCGLIGCHRQRTGQLAARLLVVLLAVVPQLQADDGDLDPTFSSKGSRR
jgi:hypothetical protein